MTDQFAMYDAAYLLGALDPADRSAYEAHLADCRHCRRAVNQLAGMPGLLAPLTLGPGARRRRARHRRFRRRCSRD